MLCITVSYAGGNSLKTTQNPEFPGEQITFSFEGHTVVKILQLKRM